MVKEMQQGKSSFNPVIQQKAHNSKGREKQKNIHKWKPIRDTAAFSAQIVKTRIKSKTFEDIKVSNFQPS